MIFTAEGFTLRLVNTVVSLAIMVGGWVGAAALLAAYFLVSTKRLDGDSLKYQALNLGGATLLAINCAASGAWPSVIANAFYILVGVQILLTVKRQDLLALVRTHMRRTRGVQLDSVQPHHASNIPG